MSDERKHIVWSDKETLVQMVVELQLKLKKKNDELTRARVRLSHAKSRLRRLKDTVASQRKRIIELYSSQNDTTAN